MNWINKTIRTAWGVGVFFLLTMPTYAKGSLFPQPKGMQGVVTTTNVNVRNHPDTRGRVVASIDQSPIRVTGKNNDWYQVWYQDQSCWIHQDYVEVERQEVIPYVKANGQNVVEYGMEFIGTPYVWGGSDLNQGVDCSGFTQEVFGVFDIDISRVSYMQAQDGPSIGKNQLQCGDLVFFDTQGINDGNVSHVGIYMGKDKFLHSDGTNGVMISNLNSPYYTRNYVKSIRVI